MKPELDESLSRFHAAIVGGASAEEAARAIPLSEVPVSSLLETFPVLMWATTPDGVPWYLNQKCVEYTGRSLSDSLRLDWMDVIHPEDREETGRSWSHAIQSGSSHQVKHRLRRADGEYRWFLTRAEPLRDREGRAIQFVGLSVDIDETVKREAEIRRLFDANIVGIVFWDLDGGIRDANDAFLRMVGYERADLVSGGLCWTDLTPPEWLKRDLEYAKQQVRLTGSVQPYEKEFLRKNGSRVPVLIGGAAFDEEIKHGVAFVVDITERKRAEQELLRSQHYLAEAQRLSHVGSWSFTATGFGYWSPELFKIHGLDPGGKAPSVPKYLALVHPDDRDFIAQEIEKILAGAEGCDFNKRVVRPDGAIRHVRYVGTKANTGGIVPEFIGVGIDVTEQERAEEERREHRLEVRLQATLNMIPAYTWYAAPGGALTFVNERCADYLGLPKDHPLRLGTETGAPWDAHIPLLHPDDQDESRKVWETCLATGMAGEFSQRVPNAQGTYRWFLSRAEPLRAKDGTLLYWVGINLDIEERKQAELSLAEAQREHLWFLESMDRINRAMQRSNDIELMTSGVMHAALEIFAGDRVVLVYPCDPETPVYHTVMEHASPQYTGALTLGIDLPATPEGAELNRRCLHDPAVVVNPRLPPELHERFCIASMLTIAIRPKGDQPYRFTVQCMRSRSWTTVELRLFEEIARRLEDALTSVLAHRNLLASQETLQALSRDLQESNAKLEEAQRIAHVGYWEWDLLTGQVNWSDETYRIYGLQPQERPIDIAACQEKIHPEDWQRGMEGALDGDRFSAECRLFRPTGEVRVAIFQGDVKRDASGKPYRMFGTVQDITDRKHAEAERREHLWFLECMDRVNRAMQRTNDVEGMMSGVLEETLAIFGSDRAWLVYPCDPDAATSRVMMEHTRPEYPGAFALGEEFPVDAQAAELLRRVLDGPGAATDLSIPPEIRERFSIQSMIAIAVRPKGDRPYLFGLHQCSHARTWTAAERRLFEEIARRLEDALSSVLAHRNLLAREEELRRSRTYLAEAQKVSHTGSWALNNVTREIVYWSEECFRIYGRDPAQGLPSLEQFLADVHPEDAPGIEKAMREGGESEGEYRMINFADGPRIVRGIAHPVLDASGRVVEYIGTAVDVTEQKRAERELRTSELERARAEQALREAREKLAQASKIASLAELSASIAHEINQPLQAIVANGHASLRWLDATPPNIEKAIRTAERVVRDGNAAAEVVSRIRALFKHTAPAKVDLDINKLILEVRSLMADEIQGNGVSLKTELGKDVPRIRADGVQIQQVIVNLVRNAIEAMAGTRRKPLLIRSRRSAGHVVVDVRDQGTGLADPEKIFEPFVSTKKTGMGMGLTICRSIIEAHGGDIRVVHNERPGVTFSFSLPIEASDAT